MKRYLPYLLIACVLVAVNLWRWLAPEEANAEPKSVVRLSYSAEDFALKMTAVAPANSGESRDIFFAKPPPVPKIVRSDIPAGPPPKSPEQLAQEEAEAEFARLKVTGIAFQGGKGQAYITRGDESFLVKTGDKLADRFEVRSITADYVSLRDTRTQIDKKIVMQGN